MARKEVIQIRCSEIEKERWRDAAEQQHLELSAWIRLTLDKSTMLTQARTAINATVQAPPPEPDDYDPWLENAPR